MEPVDGDVREELRIQVEPPFHEPGTVEHHGLDDLSVGEVMLPCLWDGTVDDRGNAEGVEGVGDDPEMTERDVGSFDEVSRGGHSRGFSESIRILRFENSTRGSN